MIQGHRPAPLGICIYCLATHVRLSEEHVIPKSLGGRLTLRDAVCDPCRIATGRLEQATLTREFIVPKTLLALRRKRARKPGPRRLEPVALEDGVASETDAARYPRHFHLPTFEPARLLVGGVRFDTRPRIAFAPCHLRIGRPTLAAVAGTRPLADPHAYGCSIAKWAYGVAVAERGLACCDTGPIRRLLLGAGVDVFDFVGTPAPLEPARLAFLHSASSRERGGWLTVLLNVFGSAGMPPYEIVIGSLAR